MRRIITIPPKKPNKVDEELDEENSNKDESEENSNQEDASENSEDKQSPKKIKKIEAPKIINPMDDPEYVKAREKTDLKYRKKGYRVILDILKSIDELKDNEVDLPYMAKEIERGCNNKAVRKAISDKIKPRWWTNVLYCEIYSAIVYKVAMNLSPTSEVGSSTIVNMILNKTIKLSNIADMHSNAMCPEKCNKIIKEMGVRLHEKVEYKITNRYQCPNCHKNKAKRREVQLRSLDEGSNISLECIYCNHEWII